MNLAEKHRPKTWADLVGLDRLTKQVDRVRERDGLTGKAYWIAGRSGQGKTSLARLMASEVADSINITEIDAGQVSTGFLDSYERAWRLFALGVKPGRALIINEAHGLRAASMRRLLVMLEDMPRSAMIIFTTTIDGQAMLFDGVDGQPLADRCYSLVIGAKEPGLTRAFAERARDIAQSENLDGRPVSAYVKLAESCGYSLRRMLQEIELGRMLK